MALELKLTRDYAKFEWTDEDAETVVSVSPNDNPEAMVRKLKRVIALVEGPESVTMLRDDGMVERVSRDRIATSLTVVEPTNGWAKFVPPPVPSHLEGEVELIKPGEDA